MSQEKCVALFVTTMLLCLLLHSNIAQATTYTVGDDGGWLVSTNISDWPKGKSFKAGDTLVFNYNPGVHNVIVVDEGGYNTCEAPANANVYMSGNDQIQLEIGTSYFICGIPGHCLAGQKIAVTAN